MSNETILAQGLTDHARRLLDLETQEVTTPGAAWVKGTGAAPQIAYWTAADTIAGDAGLTYDAANDIVTITPAVTGGITFAGASAANRTQVPDNVANALYLEDAGGLSYLQVVSSNAQPYLLLAPTTGNMKVGIGTIAPTTRQHTIDYTATNNAILDVATLGARVSGAGGGADGFGTGLIFQSESDAPADRDMVRVAGLWTTAADLTRTSAFTVSLVNNAGALTEYMRLVPLSRGDVMTAQGVAPVLSRLALGGVAGSFLSRDATDVVWSAAAGVMGTGASPQVAYWTAANTLAGDAGMVYDAANDLLTLSGASATRIIAQSADAATVTATFPLRLDHITSAAAGIGFGVGAEAYLEDDSGADQLAGSTAWRWSVAATATRRARWELRANYAGLSILCGVVEASNSIFIPDGNARGIGAVDLQVDRNAATQVASGNYSFCSNYRNTASGTNSFACGSSCIASGGTSFAAGSLCTAAGSIAVAIGSQCNATGNYSFAAGRRALTGVNAGVFIFADQTDADFTATTANQFAARANGGAWFAATDLAAAPGVFKILTLEGRVTGAGVGANNDGVGIDFKFETGTNLTYRVQGSICTAWSVAAAATSRARIEFYADYQNNLVKVGVIEAPANASAGGNARGVGAIDFGGYRAAATQVASGDYSVLLGGRVCTASGNYATAGGYSSIADKRAQVAYGNFDTTQAEAYQRSDYLVSVRVATHVDTTWYSLFTDGAATQLLIAADTLWTFSTLLQGATAGMAQRWCYKIEGAVVNDGGTTSILCQTVTSMYESDTAYDAQVVADDGTDALVFQVRRNGGSDYDVWWTLTNLDIEETYD